MFFYYYYYFWLFQRNPVSLSYLRKDVQFLLVFLSSCSLLVLAASTIGRKVSVNGGLSICVCFQRDRPKFEFAPSLGNKIKPHVGAVQQQLSVTSVRLLHKQPDLSPLHRVICFSRPSNMTTETNSNRCSFTSHTLDDSVLLSNQL